MVTEMEARAEITVLIQYIQFFKNKNKTLWDDNIRFCLLVVRR